MAFDNGVNGPKADSTAFYAIAQIRFIDLASEMSEKVLDARRADERGAYEGPT